MYKVGFIIGVCFILQINACNYQIAAVKCSIIKAAVVTDTDAETYEEMCGYGNEEGVDTTLGGQP